MKKILIITLLFTITSYAQDCPNIENDIKRLACFDKLYPKINENIDPRVLEARKKVVSDFKNPVDVLFQNEKVYTNINLKDDEVVVCGEVNGKNSYGAFVGFKRYLSFPALTITQSKDNAVKFMHIYSNVCKDTQVKLLSFLEMAQADIDKTVFHNWIISKLTPSSLSESNWVAYNIDNSGLGVMENNSLVITCENNQPFLGILINSSFGIKDENARVSLYSSDIGYESENWVYLDKNLIYKNDKIKDIVKTLTSIQNSKELKIGVGYSSS